MHPTCKIGVFYMILVTSSDIKITNYSNFFFLILHKIYTQNTKRHVKREYVKLMTSFKKKCIYYKRKTNKLILHNTALNKQRNTLEDEKKSGCGVLMTSSYIKGSFLKNDFFLNITQNIHPKYKETCKKRVCQIDDVIRF